MFSLLMPRAVTRLLPCFLLSTAQTSLVVENHPALVVVTGWSCAWQQVPRQRQGVLSQHPIGASSGECPARVQCRERTGQLCGVGRDRDAGAAWGSAACSLGRLQPLFFLGEVGNSCPLGSKKAPRGRGRERKRMKMILIFFWRRNEADIESE